MVWPVVRTWGFGCRDVGKPSIHEGSGIFIIIAPRNTEQNPLLLQIPLLLRPRHTMHPMCTFTRFLTTDLHYDRLFALRLSSRSPVSFTISASISSIRSRIDTRLRDLALSIHQIKSNSKDKEHQGTVGQRDSGSGK